MNVAFFCTGEGSFLKFIVLNRKILERVSAKIILLCDRDCGVYHFAKDRLETRLIDRKSLGNESFERESAQWFLDLSVDFVFLSCNHILRHDLLGIYGGGEQKNV